MQKWLRWLAAGLVVSGALTAAWPGRTGGVRTAHGQDVASRDNETLLAQLVCGEARGEPYEGKVAVAAVILNRTFDTRFPDSVAGVVYETDAFESVDNGEIYQGTTDECQKAARDALAGWDPSNGSIYFFAPDKTDNAFIWSRPQVRQIGRHIFAK